MIIVAETTLVQSNPTLAANDEIGNKFLRLLEKSQHVKSLEIIIRLFSEGDNNFVVLSGTVKSYFQKQMAQVAIREYAGDENLQIRNNLSVKY